MENYNRRDKARIALDRIREQYQQALEEYQNESDNFYRDLANCLRRVKGKESAKPASYFVNLLSPANDAERHSIGTTIGVCGVTAHSDEISAKYGDYELSNGIVRKYFPDLRRDVQTVTKRYAEVDENGNIVSPVHERTYNQYVYYTI